MTERRIGRVTHYYPKAGAAAVEVEEDDLHLGDVLHIEGATTDLDFEVRSLQLDHEEIEEAEPGQVVGIEVPGRVRENDDVFLVDE